MATLRLDCPVGRQKRRQGHYDIAPPERHIYKQIVPFLLRNRKIFQLRAKAI